jgi:hypothetical protein
MASFSDVSGGVFHVFPMVCFFCFQWCVSCVSDGVFQVFLVVCFMCFRLCFQMFPVVLQHEEMLQYLRRLCQMKKAPAAHNPFAKFENQLLFHILSMATMAVRSRK